MPISEVTDVNDLRSLRTLFENLGEHYVFRGQESSNWQLETSLERSVRRAQLIQNIPNREHWLVHEFSRRYAVYGASHPMPANSVDWLAIMQHHGCPTRLLDFTYSCYVGLYFAVIDAKGKDAVLWGIDLRALTRAARTLFPLVQHVEGQTLRDETRKLHHQALQEIVCSDMPAPRGILVIEPTHLSARILRQQGLFLAPADLMYDTDTKTTSFMENLSCSLKAAGEPKSVVYHELVKIRIPADMHYETLQELNRMNINAETLFPGLEGLGRSMEQLVVLPY